MVIYMPPLLEFSPVNHLFESMFDITLPMPRYAAADASAILPPIALRAAAAVCLIETPPPAFALAARTEQLPALSLFSFSLSPFSLLFDSFRVLLSLCFLLSLFDISDSHI